MNVCMVVLSYYPADPRVRREAEILGQSGIPVDVICLRAPREKRVEKFESITVYRVLNASEKEKIIDYIWLSLKFIIVAFVSLQILFLKKKYGLVQVHNMPDYLVFVGVIQKILGKPIVIDIHDLSVELFESKWDNSKAVSLQFLVRLIEKICFRLSDHLITTSLGFQARLLERGIPQDKITLVLNTADDKIFKDQSDREFRPIYKEAKLLYHGTVAKRFGLTTVVHAVARLQEMIPGSTLHIYGKYDRSYRSELEEGINNLGLGERIIMGGYLSLEEISKIIGNSDIGIVPYLRDPFMDLALSTKVFEYVAMRLPVVASRLSSLTLIFDETSIHYFEPDNSEDLANKIASICVNPKLRKKYSDHAIKAYQKISWPVMSEHYLHLIQRFILNGPQSDP